MSIKPYELGVVAALEACGIKQANDMGMPHDAGGGAPGISDQELEAALAQMSPEELQHLLSTLPQEEMGGAMGAMPQPELEQLLSQLPPEELQALMAQLGGGEAAPAEAEPSEGVEVEEEPASGGDNPFAKKSKGSEKKSKGGDKKEKSEKKEDKGEEKKAGAVGDLLGRGLQAGTKALGSAAAHPIGQKAMQMIVEHPLAAARVGSAATGAAGGALMAGEGNRLRGAGYGATMGGLTGHGLLGAVAGGLGARATATPPSTMDLLKAKLKGMF